MEKCNKTEIWACIPTRSSPLLTHPWCIDLIRNLYYCFQNVPNNNHNPHTLLQRSLVVLSLASPWLLISPDLITCCRPVCELVPLTLWCSTWSSLQFSGVNWLANPTHKTHKWHWAKAIPQWKCTQRIRLWSPKSVHYFWKVFFQNKKTTTGKGYHWCCMLLSRCSPNVFCKLKCHLKWTSQKAYTCGVR